jgi:HSP20 family molecular chaperone IbpA
MSDRREIIMDVINLNHSLVLTNTTAKSSTPQPTIKPAEPVVVSDNTATPSITVNISNEAHSLSFQNNLKAESIKFVEQADEVYKAMSFEELVNERDGEGRNRADGDTNIYAMNSYGKAAQEVFDRIRAQQMDNSQNVKNLRNSLEQFRAKVVEENSGLKSSDIDVEFKNGTLTVTGNRLTEAQKANAQRLLNGSVAEAESLRKSIAQFNEGGLNMINMMIFDEKGRFSGVNSEGKAVVHRNEAVSMDEFIQNARYGSVANSGGSYTWNKFYELVGSSNWGGNLVFEK